MINLATLFTLLRLIVSPLLLPYLILVLVPSTQWSDHIIVTSIFFVLGLTDLLDGFIARSTKQETAIGRQLDPLADKMLVLSALLPLIALERVSVIVGLVILGREFFIISLREMAATRGFVVPVIRSGKIKAAVQMAYLAFVMVIPAGMLVPFLPFISGFVVAITIWSCISYVQLFFRLLSKR